MNYEQFPIIDAHPSPDSAVSVAAMREADRRTIEGGVPSVELMRRAAQGVFEAYEGWNGRAVLILCGGGNNGGDGYALAEILQDTALPPHCTPSVQSCPRMGRFTTGDVWKRASRC